MSDLRDDEQSHEAEQTNGGEQNFAVQINEVHNLMIPILHIFLRTEMHRTGNSWTPKNRNG